MRKEVFVLSLVMLSHSALAMNFMNYTRVMNAVNERDLKMLQRLVANGVSLNSPTSNGMTPLCETVMQGDYEGYEMLQTQGASPYVPCMRQLPQEKVAAFYANQPPAHTYYVGVMASARSATAWGEPMLQQWAFPYLGAGEVLLGGIAAGAILTLGHGSASDKEKGNTYKWESPVTLTQEEFDQKVSEISGTAEYQSSNVTTYVPLWNSTSKTVSGMNFLGAINAASAYARGYSGLIVNRAADGSLVEIADVSKRADEDNAYISKEKVKVAVIDTGVWVNHPDLKTNISQTTNETYNFVYGPCTNANSAMCWKFEKNGCSDGTGTVDCYILYKNYAAENQQIVKKLVGPSATDWASYTSRYADYVYNAEDAAPFQGLAWTNNNAYWERYQDEEGWKMVYQGQSYAVTCTDEACTAGTVTIGGKEYNLGTAVDYDNHGTHVAGLVAATQNDSEKGMMGVAYNASIIPLKADLTMSETINLVSNAVDLGAKIVNFSIGAADPENNTLATFNEFMEGNIEARLAYQKAATAETILVFAAGNDGQTANANVYALAPLSDYFNGTQEDASGNTYNLNNLVVSVVALQEDLKSLEDYSSRCGDSMQYCVGAPGGSEEKLIYSTVNSDNGYTYGGMKGTSMAAPIVSGALAVIQGAFPHLSRQQVVSILLETADYIEPTAAQKSAATDYKAGSDDLGKYNSLFGRGVVNLEAATSPIGLPKISLSSTASGASVVAASSSSTVPAAFAGLVQALPENLMVLDKYNRSFQMPTRSFVHVAKHENRLEGHFKSFMRGDEKVVKANDVLTMAYSDRVSHVHSDVIHGAMSLEVKPSDRWRFKTFYTEDTQTSGGSYFERLLQTPYAKMKEAWGGAISYDLNKNWTASVLGQVGQNGFVNEEDLNDMNHNKISLFQSTLQYNGLKKVRLKMTAGLTKEQGSTLGMWGRGAFRSGNSQTAFIGAGMALNLTDDVTLEGMYYSGMTKVSSNASLVKISDIKSDSFALTASWQVKEGRTFGLQFVSPLRVRSGSAAVDLPVARDAYQDMVYRDTVRADLKPSAREYDVGVFFADTLKENVHLQSELGVRLNPDHMAGAAPDWRALIGMYFGL